MKYLSLIFIAFLSFNLNLFAQLTWEQKNSGTTEDLYSVDFLNGYMGYVAGDGDVIKATWDGGESWFMYSGHIQPSYDHWYSVSYVNEDEIYACGYNYIPSTWNEWYWVYTTDGGFNWERRSGTFVPNDSKWMDAYFLNDQVGWKVGYRDGGGYVYKTTTGIGDNWFSVFNGPVVLHSVIFVDEDNGWIVGDEGNIYNSTDGGSSWTQQTSGTTGALHSVQFINTSIGYIAGALSDSGLILNTTNGGQIWNTTMLTNTTGLRSVYFTDANNGWACGSISWSPEDRGVILYTSDGGTNWITQHIEGSCMFLTDIEFVNDTIGCVVGSDGMILKTKYGEYDLDFKSLPDMNHARYGAASAFDGENIYAICGGSNEFPSILSSIERYNMTGNSWTDFVTGLIPRRWCSAEYIPSLNKIFVFNGENFTATPYTDTVEIVDVTTGIITYSATNPHPIEYGGSAVWNEKIYVFGGSNSGVWSNRLYEFDPVSLNWTRLPDMPEAKNTNGASVDGAIYVFGGYNGSTSSRIDKYDIQSQTWIPLGNMPIGISAHRTVACGNYIFIVGTYDDIKYLAMYNTISGDFTQLTSDMIGRRHTGICVVGDTLYVYGGNQGTGVAPALTSFEFAGLSDLIVDVDDENIQVVYNFLLKQNYPNPFNPSTKIKYSIPQTSNVVIKVFDVLGNKIETLVNEEKPAGTYEIIWFAEKLPSGVYFYQLQAGDFVETKKMVLMK